MYIQCTTLALSMESDAINATQPFRSGSRFTQELRSKRLIGERQASFSSFFFFFFFFRGRVTAVTA